MPGTTSTALPSFSHDQHHKTDAAKRKGERKYWQLNQSNEHAPNYSRIKQRQRMRRYILNIHKKHRINKQDTQKSRSLDLLTSSGTPRYTHRSSALPEGALGVFHAYLWPPKAPGSTLGEGRQTSHQPTDATTHPMPYGGRGIISIITST